VNDIVTEVIDRATLGARVLELGSQIRADYAGREPVI